MAIHQRKGQKMPFALYNFNCTAAIDEHNKKLNERTRKALARGRTVHFRV